MRWSTYRWKTCHRGEATVAHDRILRLAGLRPTQLPPGKNKPRSDAPGASEERVDVTKEDNGHVSASDRTNARSRGRRQVAAGLAAVLPMGWITTGVGFVVSIVFLVTGEWLGVAVCLPATAVSLGLVWWMTRYVQRHHAGAQSPYKSIRYWKG